MVYKAHVNKDNQIIHNILMAKTSPETTEMWLPLWMHLRDTAGIMKKLIIKWLPESVLSSTGLNQAQFQKVAVFLAAIHDIGKATSYFQSIITKACTAKHDEIIGNGFVINKEYRAAGKTPHAYAGQWILQSTVTGFGLEESLSVVVGAHHGKPISIDSMMETDLIKLYPVNFYGSESDDEIKEIWHNSWINILNDAMELSGIESLDELPKISSKAQVLLSGLLIVSDWISSNNVYFPLIPLDEYGDETMYPYRVNNGWKQIDFPDVWYSEINMMDEDIFKKRFGFLPNEVQKCIIQAVNDSKTPGIYILEAQMGVGKTEAALGAAEVLAFRHQAGGIFFGLPTQATSNGLFKRLYEWGEKVSEETVNSIKLAHGSAEFNTEYNKLCKRVNSCVNDVEDKETGMEIHPWFQGNKKALLADFVVGTIDQFLMASLRRKHFMLRHLGLAGKVIIIDECHAYDAYMSTYLKRSLMWMAAYGVPVILLSATLPQNRRKKLIECYVKAYSKYYLGERKPNISYNQLDCNDNANYPVLTWSDGMSVNQKCIEQETPDKTVKIKRINSVEKMICLLDERLKDGGCACIITNTVKYAQKIYSECKNSMEDVNIILYHAQFTMPDRFKKEESLLKQMGKSSMNSDRNRLILIGTQVLEQSLDYDADVMITQLCPVDLLLQRIGRLHRHHKRDGTLKGYSRPKRLKNPECIILYEQDDEYDDGTKAIYGDYLLKRTKQILDDEINIPSDIPYLVEKVYNKEDDLGLKGEEYQKFLSEYNNRISSKEQRAEGYLLREPPKKRIENILDNEEETSEKYADASVRDATSAIEVLLMKRNKDGDIVFVEENTEKMPLLSSMRVPTVSEGRMVATQRLKLPYIFCSPSNLNKTIDELEDKNRKELAEWQQSPWLHGELILLLDNNNRAELNGYKLSYSFERGLEYEQKEEENA